MEKQARVRPHPCQAMSAHDAHSAAVFHGAIDLGTVQTLDRTRDRLPQPGAGRAQLTGAIGTFAKL